MSGDAVLVAAVAFFVVMFVWFIGFVSKEKPK